MRYVPEYNRFKSSARKLAGLFHSTSLSTCREGLAYALGYDDAHELKASAGKENLSPLDSDLSRRERLGRMAAIGGRLAEKLSVSAHDAVRALLIARPFGGPEHTREDESAIISIGNLGHRMPRPTSRHHEGDKSFLNILKDGETLLDPNQQPLAAFGFRIHESGDLEVLDTVKDGETGHWSVIGSGTIFEAGTWDVAYAASGMDNSAVAIAEENNSASRYGNRHASVVAAGLSMERCKEHLTIWHDTISRHGGALAFERPVPFTHGDETFTNVVFAAGAWESCESEDEDGKPIRMIGTELPE